MKKLGSIATDISRLQFRTIESYLLLPQFCILPLFTDVVAKESVLKYYVCAYHP